MKNRKIQVSAKDAERNLLIIALLQVQLMAIALVVPTLMAFWQSRGLSISEALFLEAWYALLIIVIEVPSGYLAYSVLIDQPFWK